MSEQEREPWAGAVADRAEWSAAVAKMCRNHADAIIAEFPDCGVEWVSDLVTAFHRVAIDGFEGIR